MTLKSRHRRAYLADPLTLSAVAYSLGKYTYLE